MLNDLKGFNRIFIAPGYTDLRKGVDSLAGLVRFGFGIDPYERNTLFMSGRGMKRKGKRDEDLNDLPVNVITHYICREDLAEIFGENGWKQLPDEISRKYRFVPARTEVDEHRIGIYVGKKDDRIIRAPHPKFLLKGSTVSPTLAAGIMNAKYVNACPIARQEKEFERYGISISRANMANRMIRLGEEYLGVMYDHLHRLLYGYHVIQADESSVLVNRDGRPAGSQSYMCGCIKTTCHPPWMDAGENRRAICGFTGTSGTYKKH